MVLLLLLLIGSLVAARVADDDPVERLGWTLLGAVGIAPPLAVGVAWATPTFIGPGLLGGIAAIVAVALFATGGGRAVREMTWRAPTAGEAVALAAAGVVAVVTALLHSDAELLLSLAAWGNTGEAECFYMQTFELVRELNPGREPTEIRDAWAIVNSPGNAFYTAPLMATLKSATFRVGDVLFRTLLFLFMQLAVHRWTGRRDLAVAGGLLSVLNPFVLSVEVLDRNVITAALSAALLFTLRARPERAAPLGWLLGLLTVSGLRFLPVVFAVSVVAVQRARRAGMRPLAVTFGVAVLPFLIAAPHLQHHGLHSMGETENLPALLSMTAQYLPRTPFLPYPTGLFYFLDLLDLLGLLVGGLAVVGGLRLLQREPAWLVALAAPVGGILFVLAVQRDWIQADKVRIALEALVPAALLAVLGVAELLDPVRRRTALRDLAVAVVTLAALGSAAARVEVDADPGTYLRQPVYQADTADRMQPARLTLRRFGLLPDYRRLGPKLDVPRKRAEARTLRAVLFPAGSPLAERAAAAGWWGGQAPAPPRRVEPAADAVDLEIDLARLPTAPREAVRVLTSDRERPVFVDLAARDQLLDVYFRSVPVPWQPQRLPLIALPLRAETWALGELYLDLNAFTSYGTDDLGFVRVAPIHFGQRPDGRQAAVANAMTALPDDGGPTIVVRVPSNFRVLVRDWLVSGVSGTPHRVDSWVIDADGRVRFLYGEPESYL